MHQILLNITQEQKKDLIKIKKKTNIHINVQIRTAIDLYLKEMQNKNFIK